MKTVLLLVGPKGSGKTTIGSLLERGFHVPFIRPVPIWLEHRMKPKTPLWENEGIHAVVAAVRAKFEETDCVVTETTGAADWFPTFVDALGRLGEVKCVRIRVPLETCGERVRSRGATILIPESDDIVEQVNRRSEALQFPFNAFFDNVSAWNEDEASRKVAQLLLSLGVLHRTYAPEIRRSSRILLRDWRDADLAPFAAMNADFKVMEFLPAPLAREESDAMVKRIRLHIAERGFGLWALEIVGRTPFAGFVGLSVPTFDAPFTPCVEVGWRLGVEHWGQGYATEGARLAVQYAFDVLRLPEVVSFTVPANQRSIRVMERLGMTYSADDDFDHPKLSPGHRLQRHVLYRLARSQGLRSRT